MNNEKKGSGRRAYWRKKRYKKKDGGLLEIKNIEWFVDILKLENKEQ